MKPRPLRPHPISLHVFHDSGARNHANVEICVCGSLKSARVHDVPDVPADVRAVEQRRMGEGDG